MLLTRCNPLEAERLRKLIAGERDAKARKPKAPKATSKRAVQLVEQCMHFERVQSGGYWQLQLGLYLSREQYNTGGARWAKAATAKKHIDFTLAALRSTFREDIMRERIRGVTLVRLSPNQLDDDNLQSAFKHVRDAVFAWIACGDSEVVRSKIGHYDATIKQGRHTCDYEQLKSEAHGVQIRLHV
jgi:hypothetical protein